MPTTIYQEVSYRTRLKEPPCSTDGKVWAGSGPHFCVDGKLVLQRHEVTTREVPIRLDDGRDMCEQQKEIVWDAFFTDLPCEEGHPIDSPGLNETIEITNRIVEGGDYVVRPGPPPLPGNDAEDDDDDDDDDDEDDDETEDDTPTDDSRLPDETELRRYDEEGIACIDDPPVTTYSMVCTAGRWRLTKTIVKKRRVPAAPGFCRVTESTYRWFKRDGPCEEWEQEYADEYMARSYWHTPAPGAPAPDTPAPGAHEPGAHEPGAHAPGDSSESVKIGFRGWLAPIRPYVVGLRNASIRNITDGVGVDTPFVLLRQEDGTPISLSSLGRLPLQEPTRFAIDFGDEIDAPTAFIEVRVKE